MRGHDEQSTHMFSYLSPEQRVPADHPLRAVRALTDEALRTMSRRFAGLYANTGRPSIPPEQLLRALLLQVLYTVRSERLLMEELNYNLLFRWFVGLNLDDPVWHPTTFTKNRDRLLAGDLAAAFFDAVRPRAGGRAALGRTLCGWDPIGSVGHRPRESHGPRGAAAQRHAPVADRCCIGRARGRKPSCIWATCCWTIDRACRPSRLTTTAEREQRRCCWRPARRRAARSGRTRATMWSFVAAVRNCDRWPDHAACGLSRQSAETETRRTGLWLDEDRRRANSGIAVSPSWIGSLPSPPRTWSGCGIWRRGVPDHRPRVSPAP